MTISIFTDFQKRQIKKNYCLPTRWLDTLSHPNEYYKINAKVRLFVYIFYKEEEYFVTFPSVIVKSIIILVRATLRLGTLLY